jgi:hypothetical protein
MGGFVSGQRVKVLMAGGVEEQGSVAYQRMDPCSSPPYSKPAAVSVVLDSRRDRPGYKGTVFLAALVTPAG